MGLVKAYQLIALVTAAASLPAQPPVSDSVVLSVHDERPLAEVLDQIEQKYLAPIMFEQVPFENAQELRAIPVKQDDGSIYTFRELPFVDFTATLGKGENTALASSQTALAAYASAGLPGVYTLVDDGDRIRVFPEQIRSASGAMRAVTPVMGYPVAFPLQTRGTVETLELIASIISRESGAQVQILNTPFHTSDTLPMGANGESASDAIAHLGAIYHGKLSYQCVYDATLKPYWVNLKSVSAPPPTGPLTKGGYIYPPATRPANAPTTSSPWLIKQ